MWKMQRILEMIFITTWNHFSFIIVGSSPPTLAYWMMNSENEIGIPKPNATTFLLYCHWLSNTLTHANKN